MIPQSSFDLAALACHLVARDVGLTLAALDRIDPDAALPYWAHAHAILAQARALRRQ